MTHVDYEAAGADKAAGDLRRAMNGSTLRWYRADVTLPASLTLRRRWLTGYATAMKQALDGYQLAADGLAAPSAGDDENRPAEPGLRAHVRELHPRITLRGQTDDKVAREHARNHHRYGSQTHHHGPNAGPHARPEGWRTGGNVTLLTERKRI